MSDFIVRPKNMDTEEKSVTITLRINREIMEAYEDLSQKSGYSRNKLINMALKYALNHLDFQEE